MAKKFEIIGQALVITDTSIPKVIFDAPKGEVYYESKKLFNDGIIKINNIDALDNSFVTAPRILLSEAIDGSDVPFTEGSFLTFARENLGFNTASGGSGAVDSVFGRTGVVSSSTSDYDASQIDFTPYLTLVSTNEQAAIEELKDELDVLASANTTLSKSSTIASSRNALLTDADGLNESTSISNITVTIPENASVAFPIGSILLYKQNAAGTISIAYSGAATGTTGQTYAINQTISVWKTGTDTWELLNPPHNQNAATSEFDLGANSIGGTAQSATGDGTTTIDWKLGNIFNFQFGAFNEVFTFTAPTNTGTFILKLVQDGTGSRTATFPASVKWSGGTAPTLTTTATTGTDIITFYFDGTDYFAVEVLNFS